MATRKPKRDAGISRIDQDEKRTHGFFVRLTRNGKIHNAFFADKTFGGKRKALKSARKHYRQLLQKHGPISRRDRAQIRRRKGSSAITGVRKTAVRRGRHKFSYWVATWSPRPYALQRKLFSVKKYGSTKAKALAVKARKAGLRKMTT